MTIDIRIRAEEKTDYFQIAEVHAQAFDQTRSIGIAVLVDTLRHRKHYDADLSLVAEADGRILGHVLFTEHRLRVEGKELRAVALAPSCLRFKPGVSASVS
ncbi:GNAT family N-acetyltransferase [Paenibacillus sp. P26]|nr:GNAT family N-acetyltransferase [Paenibacillus sp. P26]UUZ92162.1 GNAT family N-acetyltransferase [Paenibacillus sp. P25]